MLILLAELCIQKDNAITNQICTLDFATIPTSTIKFENSIIEIDTPQPIISSLIQIFNTTFNYSTITQSLTLFSAATAIDVNFLRIEFALDQKQLVTTTIFSTKVLVVNNFRLFTNYSLNFQIAFSTATAGLLTNAAYVVTHITDPKNHVTKTGIIPSLNTNLESSKLPENISILPLNFITIQPPYLGASLEKFYTSQKISLLCTVSGLLKEYCNFNVDEYKKVQNGNYIVKDLQGLYVPISVDSSEISKINSCESVFNTANNSCLCGVSATGFSNNKCDCPVHFDANCDACEGNFLLSLDKLTCKPKCSSCVSQCYYDGFLGSVVQCLCGDRQVQAGTECVNKNLQMIRTGLFAGFCILFAVITGVLLWFILRRQKQARALKEQQ